MEGLAAFITITLMIIIVPGPDFFCSNEKFDYVR